MNLSRYIFYVFYLCVLFCSCRTVNNYYYYTVVDDSATHNKKLLAGRWLFINCSGYDSSSRQGLGVHTIFSYDTVSHIITVNNYFDTSATPQSVNNYFVDSMVLNIDSNGYYIIREAFSKNSATTIIDSFASTWTYIWTTDSSSALLLNPFGVAGQIFLLEVGGYSSSSGNLIVQSLDSTKLVLAAKNQFGSSALPQWEHLDVRYILKKQ